MAGVNRDLKAWCRNGDEHRVYWDAIRQVWVDYKGHISCVALQPHDVHLHPKLPKHQGSRGGEPREETPTVTRRNSHVGKRDSVRT